VRTHDLKTVQPFYDQVVAGDKTVEVRRDDRRFLVGDLLWLREYDPERGYSGRFTVREVTHLLFGWGVEPGYVALSLRPLAVFHEGTSAKPRHRPLAGHHASQQGSPLKVTRHRNMPAATRRSAIG
jgi:hypothetical protein